MSERKKWRIAEYALIGWPAHSACRVGVDPMPQHLPECLVPDFETGRWVCICKYLRACEERVFAFHPEWTADTSEPDCAPCRRLTELFTERMAGYKEGLEAAREAVEAMDLHGCTNRWIFDCNCIGPKVIAVIDALRKESQ